MPPLNQFFASLGGLCLVLAFGRTAGPPLAAGARQAVFPYTTAGKQELCVTRLNRVAQALALYGQDHEGRFPPLDYQNGQKQRVTWVSLLNGQSGQKDQSRQKGQVLQEDWACPQGTSLSTQQARFAASYVMNPVLAMAKPDNMDAPASALMLADGGDRHDVSLLPPFQPGRLSLREPGTDI